MEKTETTSRAGQAQSSGLKRPYDRPVLRVYGRVSALTQAKTQGAGDGASSRRQA